MFHWKDGWYFSRQDNGSVTMEHRVYEDEFNELGQRMYHYNAKVNIPAAEWASIVAAVSISGETAQSYQDALTFHNGK